MPAYQYTVEDKLRALALFLDYHPFSDISAMEGMPNRNVLARWAQEGFEIDGVKVSWHDFRELVEAKRAVAQHDRHVKEVKKFVWDDYVRDHAEEVAEQLRTARQAIIDGLGQTNKKGDLVVKMNVADLPKIVQAEMLIQGKATHIVEQRKIDVQVLGAIIAHHATLLIKDDGIRAKLLDRIAMDFEKVEAMGADVREFKQLTQ